MGTAQVTFGFQAARERASFVVPVAPAIAASFAFLLYMLGATQVADPVAYLVGMAPIGWIATEGAWRLYR